MKIKNSKSKKKMHERTSGNYKVSGYHASDEGKKGRKRKAHINQHLYKKYHGNIDVPTDRVIICKQSKSICHLPR